MFGFGISAISYVMEEKAVKLRANDETHAGLVSFFVLDFTGTISCPAASILGGFHSRIWTDKELS